MDLNDYWQENKRFVTWVAGGVIVFLAGRMVVSSLYDADLRARSREVNQRRTDLRKPMFSAQDLADAQAENDALQAAVERLQATTGFDTRSAFQLDPGRGSASSQYLRSLSRVREELLPRAGRSNLQLDPALGMPRLSPTREAEIERYLEALDVITRVVDLAIESGVQRVDRVQVRLDPGLDSREGLGDVERTRVQLTLSGDSLALVRLLSGTQRPRAAAQALNVMAVELLPSRAKEDEARLELTLVIARIVRPAEEEV